MAEINKDCKIISNTPIRIGDFTATCSRKSFIINNHGMKLVARDDENLKKIIFDTEKKTVSVVVTTPTLPNNAPRIVDLSENAEFFDELRNNIEKILINKTWSDFTSVIPNEDRTVFEVS